MKSRRTRTKRALWLVAAALVMAQPLAALGAPTHRHDETCCCLVPPEPEREASCCSTSEPERPLQKPQVDAQTCDCRTTPTTPTPRKPIAPVGTTGTSAELGAWLARGAWISGHTPLVDHATQLVSEARAGPLACAADPILLDRVRPTPRRLLARGVPGHLAELSIARL
ncbi:MAG: hypothetical protein O7B99_04685 [Planctomycetota bacterium]|nr:hypothetical protein [Planctomycetota bacterium]